MTRAECEERILEKLKEIEAIHKEYNPNATYLTLCIFNGYHFNNTYWEDENDENTDINYPINYDEFK